MIGPECPDCGQLARWDGQDGSTSGGAGTVVDVWECPDGHRFTTEYLAVGS